MQSEAYQHYTQILKSTLLADDRVIGLVAMGSMAAMSRLPDAWSDHDFFLITQPGEQEDFRQDLSWLPDHEGIVLSIRETAHGLKVLYTSGHLVEFAVFDAEELSVAKANDYRILIDRADIAQRMTRITVQPEDGAKPYDALRDCSMVIALVYVGAGRYARGEHISAHAFIKNYTLGHLLPLLARLLPAEDKSRFDNLDPFRRFEQVFPDVGAEIEQAMVLPPLQTGEALLDILERHIQPILDNFPAEAVATVRAYLQQAQERQCL